VLAFGANYPWAYTPLALTSATLGLALLAAGRSPVSWPVVAGLGCVAAACLAQLVPLPSTWLREITPSTDSVLREYQLGYAAGTWGRISVAPDSTWVGLGLFAAFALMMVGAARFLTRSSARNLALSIVLLGTVAAVVGIVQRATFNGKIYGFWEPEFAGTVFGPFVNRNHFAGWMLMAVPLTLGLLGGAVSRGMRSVRPTTRDRLLWFSSPEANQAILIAGAAIVMALSLVLTMSRSGMLALAAALMLMAVVAVARHASAGRRIAHTAYLVVLVVGIIAWVGVDAVAARFEADSTVTLSGRLEIWGDTLAIARDFWLTGTGLNTYGVATLFYQKSLPQFHLREAHSDYLQLAAEGGLLLCVPVLLTVALFAREVRRRFQSSEGSSYWLRAGAVTGIVAIAIQSTVEFSLQMPGNAALFAVSCAIALHHEHNPR
jgi:O-antigen ligase